jgi:hypothetical protein
MRFFGRTRDDLVSLAAAPTIWGGHFIACYAIAALDCAPNSELFKPLLNTRLAVGVATAIALILIGLILRRAWREWKAEGGGVIHNHDSAAGRERFLEFSTMLVAALSFVGVLFDALPALLIGDCR